MSVVVHAIETELEAAHGCHGVRSGYLAEGVPCTFGVAFRGHLFGSCGEAPYFLRVADVFETPDAELTPFADGHGLDKLAFGFGFGLMLGDETAEEGFEALREFAVDQDGGGG